MQASDPDLPAAEHWQSGLILARGVPGIAVGDHRALRAAPPASIFTGLRLRPSPLRGPESAPWGSAGTLTPKRAPPLPHALRAQPVRRSSSVSPACLTHFTSPRSTSVAWPSPSSVHTLHLASPPAAHRCCVSEKLTLPPPAFIFLLCCSPSPRAWLLQSVSGVLPVSPALATQD